MNSFQAVSNKIHTVHEQYAFIINVNVISSQFLLKFLLNYYLLWQNIYMYTLMITEMEGNEQNQK